MDFSDQILCRFQKYKQKVPPPSLPFGQKKRRLKVQFMEVPGYTKIQKNNFKNIFFDLSEKKFLVPICKKLNNFCLDDGKKRFLEKKICFHKKQHFFFRMEGVTVEELFAYIFGIYIKFG